MRYTADPVHNARCMKGQNYIINEQTKTITYNPLDNLYGERDYTTTASIRHMLYILAINEPGYVIETTINGAHFTLEPGMDFDTAWQIYQEAMHNTYPIEENTAYEKQGQQRLAGIKFLDTADVISRLSGIYVPDADYDNADIAYVITHLKDYKYNDSLSAEENIIAAFPQYPLQELVNIFKSTVSVYKKQGKDLQKLCSRNGVIELAERLGIPGKIPVADRIVTNMSRPMGIQNDQRRI